MRLLLAIAEILYLPTAQVWALSWWSGPGFAIGADAVHSLTSAPVAPVPAVPLFAAMPHTVYGNWWMTVLVILGIGCGWWLYTGYARFSILEHLGVIVIASVCVSTVIAASTWLANGSVGPGRMALLGVTTLPVLSRLSLTFTLPLVLVFLLLHPRVRGAFNGRRHLPIPNRDRVGVPEAEADNTVTEWINLIDGSIHTGQVPTVVTAAQPSTKEASAQYTNSEHVTDTGVDRNSGTTTVSQKEDELGTAALAAVEAESMLLDESDTTSASQMETAQEDENKTSPPAAD